MNHENALLGNSYFTPWSQWIVLLGVGSFHIYLSQIYADCVHRFDGECIMDCDIP